MFALIYFLMESTNFIIWNGYTNVWHCIIFGIEIRCLNGLEQQQPSPLPKFPVNIHVIVPKQTGVLFVIVSKIYVLILCAS